MTKEGKTARLKQLKEKFNVLDRSKRYLEKELANIIGKKKVLGEKIRKEKQAIALAGRVKRLRS
jgi:hypothetical protein